jgi:hypothetical protein
MFRQYIQAPRPVDLLRGGRATATCGPREPRPMSDVIPIFADVERGDRQAAAEAIS